MKIIPYLICLIIIALFAVKNAKRPYLKWRLRKSADELIKSRLDCVKIEKRIAVGNVGAVYMARLNKGWLTQLGIRWQVEYDLPDKIILKLACFNGNEEQRVQILEELAPIIVQNQNAKRHLPICPFLALGLVENSAKDKNFVVEIMPYIEGENLKKIMNTNKLKLINREDVLKQLIQILNTAVFLDDQHFYTRNLDAENVIVQPDGRWLRIDFDNVSRKDKKPAKRMRRLCKLSISILKQLKGKPHNLQIINLISKIKATLKHIERNNHVEGAKIVNTSQLIEEISLIKDQIE